jgi:hypothetical protein
MAQIRGAKRSVPRRLYPLAACPAERREHATGCADALARPATKPEFIAQANNQTLAQVFELCPCAVPCCLAAVRLSSPCLKAGGLSWESW